MVLSKTIRLTNILDANSSLLQTSFFIFLEAIYSIYFCFQAYVFVGKSSIDKFV